MAGSLQGEVGSAIVAENSCGDEAFEKVASSLHDFCR